MIFAFTNANRAVSKIADSTNAHRLFHPARIQLFILLVAIGVVGTGCGYIWIEELSLENQDSGSGTEAEQSKDSTSQTGTDFHTDTAISEGSDTQSTTDTIPVSSPDTMTETQMSTDVPLSQDTQSSSSEQPATDTVSASDSDTAGDTDTDSSTETTTVVDTNTHIADSQDSATYPDTDAFTNSVSLRFNGADEYLSFGDLMLSTGTISFWLKTRAEEAYLVSRVKIGGSAFGEARIRLVAGELRFTIEDPAIREVSANAVVNDDVWHHVAFTFHPGMALFVDGVLQEPVDTIAEAGFEVEGEILTVGNNSPLDEGYYIGLIDEFAMYSRALEGSEIAEIWNNHQSSDLTTLPTAENLVHWWRMGDGDTALLLTDQVGSVDATMVNMDGTNFVADAP